MDLVVDVSHVLDEVDVVSEVVPHDPSQDVLSHVVPERDRQEMSPSALTACGGQAVRPAHLA